MEQTRGNYQRLMDEAKLKGFKNVSDALANPEFYNMSVKIRLNKIKTIKTKNNGK